MSVLRKMIKTKKKKLLIRIPLEEFETIEMKAGRYAKGNLTQWIIHASASYEPSEEELLDSYISGEACVACGKDQEDCKCTDQEIDAATRLIE